MFPVPQPVYNRDPIGRWEWRREQKCRESEIEGIRCCGGQEKTVSDEQLAGLLQDAGMPISRRTVAKYRMELGIGGAFQRKDG